MYVVETDIYKSFGNKEILKGLNINVPKGAIYGLVGKNGAGKTTFMRIISGLQKESKGEYKLFGVSSGEKNIRNARKRIGAVIESPALYPNMTSGENIKQQMMLLGIPSLKEVDRILLQVGLNPDDKTKVKDMSVGQKQKLGIAMAFAGNPDLIILDEPMNGLDPEGIIDLRETILRLNREKDITFIISSHILSELSKIATDYGFIRDGKIIEEISHKALSEKVRGSLEDYYLKLMEGTNE